MSYPQAVHYLDSFVNYEKKTRYPYKESFKLDRIRDFLERIGAPQDSLRCIHIAGTKGKGSVSAFAASILREAGYTTGLYTSPHLSVVRERIRILRARDAQAGYQPVPDGDDFEGMIGKRALAGLVERLRPEIDRYNRISPYGPLSFFEVYTALAFQYFKEEEVDFAVLETGLGGRLDATNVVWPHVCGITSISLDHTQKLGDTPAAIAAEKAGIIKSRQSAGIPSSRLAVVSAPQETEVMRVLRDRCRQEGADFYEVGKDICCREGAVTGDSQRFTISGIAGEFRDVAIRLLGSYQPVNAALAVSLVVLLAQRNGLRIEERGVREGLYRTVWPGRFEIVSRDPVIVLDGAHNPASAGELRRNLEAYFPGKRIILILGISLDKDIRGICAELIPYSNEVILSRANNPRAASPAHIADCARGCGGGARTMHVTADISRALELARKNNTADSVIVTAGSLFLVAEARERLMKELRTGAR